MKNTEMRLQLQLHGKYEAVLKKMLIRHLQRVIVETVSVSPTSKVQSRWYKLGTDIKQFLCEGII